MKKGGDKEGGVGVGGGARKAEGPDTGSRGRLVGRLSDVYRSVKPGS